MEIFVDYTCFHEKGVPENLGSSKKVIFLLKIVYLAFGFTTLAENLPTQWQLGALCPLNIYYCMSERGRLGEICLILSEVIHCQHEEYVVGK